MTDLIDLHIYDVRHSDLHHAMAMAEHFAEKYPDRIGPRNGVVCVFAAQSSLYVYRTPKGRIVVRGVLQ